MLYEPVLRLPMFPLESIKHLLIPVGRHSTTDSARQATEELGEHTTLFLGSIKAMGKLRVVEDSISRYAQVPAASNPCSLCGQDGDGGC